MANLKSLRIAFILTQNQHVISSLLVLPSSSSNPHGPIGTKGLSHAGICLAI